MLKKFIIFALTFILITALAHSQITQTGSLVGRVTDDEGGALPDVTVSIKSPALILAQMESITNERGYYRFPSLPIGFYTVKFELDGFQSLIRENIRVEFGVTINLDVSLKLKKLEETIVVTGGAPTVDKQSTTLSSSLTSEFIASIPSSREIMTYLNMIPGVIGDPWRPEGSSSHGSSAKENVYNLDGVNTSAPVSGTQRGGYSIDIIEEISVQSGALPAEYGRARGAVINVLTKSGGNDFHGSGQFYYRNIDLQSDNTKGTPLEGEKTGFNYEYDMGFNLGGPIIKNKIWFFANFGYKTSQSYVFGYPYDKTENTPINDKYIFPYGKLTYRINPKNKLSLSYHLYHWKNNHYGASYQYNEDATYIRKRVIGYYSIHYEKIFTTNWMMNAKVGYMDFKQMTESKNDQPQYYDTTTRLYSVGYQYNRTLYRSRLSALISSTYFLDNWIGMHEFKGGIEFEYSRERHDRRWNRDERGLGPRIYTRNGGEPYYVRFYQDYDRKDNRLTFAGFIQDAWQPTDRLSLNLGVRFDHAEGIVPKQGLDREPFVVDADTIIDLSVPKSFKPIIWNNFSPRLGATYDITGDGKTVLKTSFGRYHMELYFFHIDVNPNGTLSWRYRLKPDWTLDYERGMYGVSAPALNIMDPDLKSPHIDEFTLGIDREIIENLSLSVRYIKKWDRNLVEDADINALDLDELKTTGEIRWKNYQPVTAIDPFTGNTVTFYEKIDASIPRERYKTNPPGAERDYDGLEISLNKRFSKGWMMLASYVYAYSRGLIGSHLAESQSTYNFFDDPNTHINAIGRYPLENRHQFKLHGAFNGPFGINVSGYFRYFSGGRYTRTISSNDLGLDLNQGNVTIYAEKRGSRGYPAQYILDFRLEKVFSLPGEKGKLSFIVDAFNLFNSNVAAEMIAISSNPNYTFGEATSIIGPRIIRLGIKFEF